WRSAAGERKPRPNLPAPIGSFDNERDRVRGRGDRQVGQEALCSGRHLLGCAVVPDRQVRDDLSELPSVRQIIGERLDSLCRELDETRPRIGSKPEDLLLKPADVGEPKLKAANARGQPAELGSGVLIDFRRLDERKENRDVGRDAEWRERVQPLAPLINGGARLRYLNDQSAALH